MNVAQLHGFAQCDEFENLLEKSGLSPRCCILVRTAMKLLSTQRGTDTLKLWRIQRYCVNGTPVFKLIFCHRSNTDHSPSKLLMTQKVFKILCQNLGNYLYDIEIGFLPPQKPLESLDTQIAQDKDTSNSTHYHNHHGILNFYFFEQDPSQCTSSTCAGGWTSETPLESQIVPNIRVEDVKCFHRDPDGHTKALEDVLLSLKIPSAKLVAMELCRELQCRSSVIPILCYKIQQKARGTACVKIQGLMSFSWPCFQHALTSCPNNIVNVVAAGDALYLTLKTPDDNHDYLSCDAVYLFGRDTHTTNTTTVTTTTTTAAKKKYPIMEDSLTMALAETSRKRPNSECTNQTLWFENLGASMPNDLENGKILECHDAVVVGVLCQCDGCIVKTQGLIPYDKIVEPQRKRAKIETPSVPVPLLPLPTPPPPSSSSSSSLLSNPTNNNFILETPVQTPTTTPLVTVGKPIGKSSSWFGWLRGS